jgi:hypothetical protein
MKAFWLPLSLVFFSWIAHGDLKPDKVHVSDTKKDNYYIHDGLFVGGDRAIDEVAITDIRRANSAKFERVVIDLEGTQMGEPSAIPRPPFYQVAVSPDEKRLVVTVWGKPRLEFDAKKAVASFAKSANFSSVSLLPKVEEDSWTFVMNLKSDRPVEVFELTHPVRVIVDVQNSR